MNSQKCRVQGIGLREHFRMQKETVEWQNKGNCGMAEYMVRNWNAWHHHMALVMLAMLILLFYQKKFKKMYKMSIPGVIWILKYHNPLKRIDAWEIARILNQDNELRRKTRVSRLRGS